MAYQVLLFRLVHRGAWRADYCDCRRDRLINKKVASALLYAGTPIAVAGIILLFGGFSMSFYHRAVKSHPD
jgi:hypothetical protein